MRTPASLTSLGCAFALTVASPSAAQVKRSDVPGYTFSPLTVNNLEDTSPRVSSNGNIIWTGRYNLAGATSGTTDYEVLLWNGATIRQVTDDDLVQERVVVNDFGDMAWQVDGSGLSSEIVVHIGGVRSQITNDPAPGIVDRYPDISDLRTVVWGRLVTTQYLLSVYDGQAGTPFSTFGVGYRPHINNAGHIHAAGVNGIFNTSYQVVVPMGTPSSYGYREFRRSEINELDQLALEAERLGPANPDLSGPRDIVFWNGTAMRTIFRSPGPWHGRADLNDAGVIVWEGFGGLPGSTSGSADYEVFVYDPAIRQVVQLTDDDALDQWGTITGDGTIVWLGNGAYPGTSGAQWDREIFRAMPTPDADQDGVPNAADNCALRANSSQSDTGGPGSALGDGIGNACQCGDVSDDGIVNAADVQDLRSALAKGSFGALTAPAKCRVNGAWAPCSALDVALLRRALASPTALGPGLVQTCDASLQF